MVSYYRKLALQTILRLAHLISSTASVYDEDVCCL